MLIMIQLNSRCDRIFYKINDTLLVLCRQSDEARPSVISSLLGFIKASVAELSQAGTYRDASASGLSWQLFCETRLLLVLLSTGGDVFNSTTTSHLTELPVMLLTVLTRTMSSLASISNDIGTKDAKNVLPIWLSPTMLLLDLLERTMSAKDNLSLTTRLYSAPGFKYEWQFQNSDPRLYAYGAPSDADWTSYDAQNNTIVETAYLRGSREARINAHGTNYSIDLANMTQLNTETYNHRRIRRAAIPLDPQTQSQAMELNPKLTIAPTVLHPEAHFAVLNACVQLLSVNLDQECLDATLRLAIRLTRSYDSAQHFFDRGGLASLLTLRQGHTFKGFGLLLSVRMHEND